MITVKEIAKMCNVSPSTVSNILNGKNNMTAETREKVLACIEETGYRPNYFAQGMRRQNNRTICIIAEEICQFSSPRIVESIMMYCENHGYRTIFINLGMYNKWDNSGVRVGSSELNEENTTPAFLEAQAIRADGVIFVAAHGRELNIVPDNYDIPVVYAYAYSKDNKYKSVIIDEQQGGESVINYLFSKGHSKVGIIAGSKDSFHTKERLQGVINGYNRQGIAFDEDLVVYGDWQRKSGYECVAQLIEKNVTAIWAMNDIMALGAYDYIREHDLIIGKDISVVGFDDREIASYAYPPLTTAAINLDDIGVLSAKMIIEEVEKSNGVGTSEAPRKITSTFIERKSVSYI